MKHLRLINIFYLGLLFSVTLVTSCNKNPVGINLNEEDDFIPWELISGKIAYRYTSLSSDNTVKSSEIIIIDGDERTVKSIIKDNSLTFHKLAWAKDGEKFVYSDFKSDSGRWELHEINMSSEEQKHIYPSELHCDYPSYSYNGKLAYTNGWVNILIDGEVFYRGDVNATPPSWSPDGNYIVASISDSTSQGALYKISLNDTTKVPLLQGKGPYNNEIFSDPSFSPDGRKIAYVKLSHDINNSSLWLMDADGYNQKQLTNGPNDWHSEWSPDGERILFERDSHLFIINIDGGGLRQVTKSRSPYHGQFPEWIH
jgi:Tol biopolymer transport system component